MCLAACYWANVERIVFALSSERASELGLGDRYVYEQISLPAAGRDIIMVEMPLPGDAAPFAVRHRSRSGLEPDETD